MLYLWLSLGLMFVSVFLMIWAGGEALANRLSAERGVYERVVGKELRRLFMDISPQEFVLIHLLVFLGGIGFGIWAIGDILGGVFGGVAGLIAPRIYLKLAWNSRIIAIDEQVEEAMTFMSNSFKANPSLPEAFQDVINAMGAPITQEFSVLLKEYALGTPLDQSLINLQRRMPSRNLGLAIAALSIGRAVGGNIPQILTDIGSTIRESYRLERVIDTQTAQGRMQAWVMGLMPLVVLVVFYLMDPELIQPLFETFMGYIILAIAATLNVIGVLLILKIVSIEV